jgi:hypothetical protein
VLHEALHVFRDEHDLGKFLDGIRAAESHMVPTRGRRCWTGSETL